MKPVTVAAFNSRMEALPLRDCLIDAGIPAEIRADLRVDPLMDSARPGTGVRVEVPREHFETALHLVEQWNSESDEITAGIPVLPPDATRDHRPGSWLEGQ